METTVIVADYSDKKQGSEIIQLMNAYASDPMGGGKPLLLFVQENLVSELAKRSFAFSLICYVGTEPAGLINCFEGFSSFACKPLINIHDVIVLSEFRGLGISQRLLDEVDSIAEQRGCCKVTLEVLEGNQAAKNAYLKHGFAGYELDPEMGKAEFWQKPLNTPS